MWDFRTLGSCGLGNRLSLWRLLQNEWSVSFLFNSHALQICTSRNSLTFPFYGSFHLSNKMLLSRWLMQNFLPIQLNTLVSGILNFKMNRHSPQPHIIMTDLSHVLAIVSNCPFSWVPNNKSWNETTKGKAKMSQVSSPFLSEPT